MSSTGLKDSAAPAAEMNDADAETAFAAMAAKRFDEENPEEVVEEVPAETPAPVEPVAVVKPAAAAPAAAAPDIWANATPELKAAHEAEISAWDQKYKSDIGRQAAHQRRIQALEDELRAEKAAKAATVPTPAKSTLPLRERPEIAKSLEDYPEVVGPLLDAIEPVVADNASLRRDIAQIHDDRRQVVQSQQEAALQAAHPDWQAAVVSPEFKDWLSSRPASIRAIAQRNGNEIVDAEEAIAMVGDFKAHHALTHPKIPAADPVVVPPNKLEERRARQLDSVIAAPLKTPTGIPDGAPGGSEKAMFDHFAAKKSQRK